MKSITIHGVDEHLAGALKAKAEAAGLSMNRTIKGLLEQALGLKPRPEGGNRELFEEFLGVWSKEDLVSFQVATADLEVVDERDW